VFFSPAPPTGFHPIPGVELIRPTPRYVVARSTGALPPRQLVELGRRLRLAWRAAVPLNARVNELLIADRDALRDAHACPAYGVLGDPDISPHWPPVRGPQ
jgi:hypothetical protein